MMAKKTTEHIETIFDHDITEKELDEFFISKKEYEEEEKKEGFVSKLTKDFYECRTREGYLKQFLDDRDPYRDTLKRHISRLYDDRKNMKMAYKYANMIKNKVLKQDLLNLLGGF